MTAIKTSIILIQMTLTEMQYVTKSQKN